jgi:hypothetical protein
LGCRLRGDAACGQLRRGPLISLRNTTAGGEERDGDRRKVAPKSADWILPDWVTRQLTPLLRSERLPLYPQVPADNQPPQSRQRGTHFRPQIPREEAAL